MSQSLMPNTQQFTQPRCRVPGSRKSSDPVAIRLRKQRRDLSLQNSRGDRMAIELFRRFCSEIKDFSFGLTNLLKLT
jgi:hypothetical protein